MPKKPEGYSSVSPYLVVDGALEAGGVSVQESQRKEGDPDRGGGVKEPAGATWWIATRSESS